MGFDHLFRSLHVVVRAAEHDVGGWGGGVWYLWIRLSSTVRYNAFRRTDAPGRVP